mmetsp:Transcript_15720/g.36116  ORF Transcript_15720/g.36116 Transcript_15720/m.36116 type:complete len:251 (+) Transcript_15720:374-1126(+)
MMNWVLYCVYPKAPVPTAPCSSYKYCSHEQQRIKAATSKTTKEHLSPLRKHVCGIVKAQHTRSRLAPARLELRLRCYRAIGCTNTAAAPHLFAPSSVHRKTLFACLFEIDPLPRRASNGVFRRWRFVALWFVALVVSITGYELASSSMLARVRDFSYIRSPLGSKRGSNTTATSRVFLLGDGSVRLQRAAEATFLDFAGAYSTPPCSMALIATLNASVAGLPLATGGGASFGRSIVVITVAVGIVGSSPG